MAISMTSQIHLIWRLCVYRLVYWIPHWIRLQNFLLQSVQAPTALLWLRFPVFEMSRSKAKSNDHCWNYSLLRFISQSFRETLLQSLSPRLLAMRQKLSPSTQSELVPLSAWSTTAVNPLVKIMECAHCRTFLGCCHHGGFSTGAIGCARAWVISVLDPIVWVQGRGDMSVDPSSVVACMCAWLCLGFLSLQSMVPSWPLSRTLAQRRRLEEEGCFNHVRPKR